LTLVDQH